MPGPVDSYRYKPRSSLPPQRRRRRPWAPLVALVLVLVVLVSGGLAVGRTWSFLQQAANLGNPLEELQRSIDPRSGTLPWKLNHGQRVNILLLGYGGAENDAPWLTDTMMVMSIDPANRRAVEVSIPRDMGVKIDAFANREPAVDKIIFQIMPEESARIAALRTGNIQFTVLTAAGFDTIKSDTAVKAVEGPTLSYFYLGMNVAKPPFDKPQVRQAISYAVDRGEIISSVFRGHARVTGPVPSAMADWAVDTAQFETYTPNVEKAKQLMADAGVSNVKTTMSAISSLPAQVDAAQVIRSQLLKIGIDAEVTPLETGVYVDTWKKKGMELMVGGNGSGTNPDRAVCFFFCTDGSANVWNYSNPKVDSDGVEARSAPDQARAKSLYDDAQKIIVTDAPNLFLANQNQFLAYSPKLVNFTPMPDESWQGLITAGLQP